eukprot:c6217_g1_i1.p1 GENE.c6217_g1_i1~~c6217_g1_i1.p1  ORF type:complete len:516 (+),score=96.21 c6217_g1_i1:28-1575(+)
MSTGLRNRRTGPRRETPGEDFPENNQIQPPTQAPIPTIWRKETQGHFQKIENTENNQLVLWNEHCGDGASFTFRDDGIDDNGNLVLYDESRNLSVLLTATEFFWGSGRAHAETTWNKLGNGHWQTENESDLAQHTEGNIITVHVCKTTAEITTLEISDSTFIRDVKAALEEPSGIAIGQQLLVHKGKVLSDFATLADSGVLDEHKIFIVRSASAAMWQQRFRHQQPLQQQYQQQQRQEQAQPAQPRQTSTSSNNDGNQLPPTTPHPPTTSHLERQCRICLGGDTEGRLFAPCLCRGTVGLVHRECLNAWRSNSPNPSSLIRCDQCGYEYRIVRASFADLLLSQRLVMFVSGVLIIALVVLSGLVSSLSGIHVERHFYDAVVWYPSWHDKLISPPEGIWKIIPSPWRALSPWWADTIVAGCVICGFVGACMVWHRQYVQDPEHFMGRVMPVLALNMFCNGLPIMRLVAAVGLVVAWKEGLYVFVSKAARQALVKWGEMILEVHQDQPEQQQQQAQQ